MASAAALLRIYKDQVGVIQTRQTAKDKAVDSGGEEEISFEPAALQNQQFGLSSAQCRSCMLRAAEVRTTLAGVGISR
jgi:hypothetical protein